ncbi:recombinase family protein [Nocardia sp. NPDC049526]|uniref:recombinase family protein n=1 Tax=Nocardia sp. NPDC049526 TaxID=3364316 RepID=UPI0037B085EB
MVEPFRVGDVRCSTDEQDVEIQTDQLISLGVPHERIFVDKGFSGTTRKNRTGLNNALTAVTSAAAAVTNRQVVLTTTKFDRFARNMAEAGEIMTSLRERDVLFGLGSQIYDWNDPFGKLFLQIPALVAEFEANLNHLRGDGEGPRERPSRRGRGGAGCFSRDYYRNPYRVDGSCRESRGGLGSTPWVREVVASPPRQRCRAVSRCKRDSFWGLRTE